MRIAAVLGPELVGVREQVDEHLREPRRIALHDRQIGGQLDLERLAALREEAAEHLGRILDDLRQRDRLAPDAQLPGLDAHALEQVVDQARQPQRAALQRGHERLQLVLGHLPEAVVQQLDRGELRGERRAELVRDVREHEVARAPHGLDLGLVAHHLHLHPVDGLRAGDHDGAARPVGALEHLGRAPGSVGARPQDRAIGFARPYAVRADRPQHVAAEAADDFAGLDAQHPGCLRVGVADGARGIDREDALDHALRAPPAPRLRAAEARS